MSIVIKQARVNYLRTKKLKATMLKRVCTQLKTVLLQMNDIFDDLQCRIVVVIECAEEGSEGTIE